MYLQIGIFRLFAGVTFAYICKHRCNNIAKQLARVEATSAHITRLDHLSNSIAPNTANDAGQIFKAFAGVYVIWYDCRTSGQP